MQVKNREILKDLRSIFEHPQVQQALYEAYENEIPSYLEAGKMGSGSMDAGVMARVFERS